MAFKPTQEKTREVLLKTSMEKTAELARIQGRQHTHVQRFGTSSSKALIQHLDQLLGFQALPHNEFSHFV